MMNRKIFNDCMEQLRVDHNKKWSNEEISSIWEYCKIYPDLAFYQVVKALHECYALKISKIKAAFDKIPIDRAQGGAEDLYFCEYCGNTGWVSVGKYTEETFKSVMDGKTYTEREFHPEGVAVCTCGCVKANCLKCNPDYIRFEMLKGSLDHQEYTDPAKTYAIVMDEKEMRSGMEALVDSVGFDESNYVPF